MKKLKTFPVQLVSRVPRASLLFFLSIHVIKSPKESRECKSQSALPMEADDGRMTATRL